MGMAPFIQNPRRRPRVPLRIDVEIVQGGETWRAETENLGPGGCLVSSPRPLVERARLRLVLRCDDVKGALDVAGSVAWAREGQGGIAFTPRQFGLTPRPEAWFKQILEARPGLASALQRIPERLALEAPLFLLPPPRRIVDLTPDEMALLQRADNGITVHALLSAAEGNAERAARALFALFEKNVFTLSVGQASEKWRWRATASGAERPSAPNLPGREPSRERPPLPAIPAPSTCAPGVTPPARGAPPLDATSPRPIQPVPGPPVVRPAAQDATFLRGAVAARRSPQAQACLEQARAAAAAARIDRAVVLLRQALALAPRDAEISALLGEYAFKDRKIF